MKNRNQLNYAFCHAYRTGNVSVATVTSTTVVYNTVVSDPLGMLNPATGFVEILSAGYYIMNAGIWWNGESSPVASSYRFIQFEVSTNGGSSFGIMAAPSVIRANNATSSDTVHSGSGIFGPFNNGDLVRVRVAQASGETITLFGGLHTRVSLCQVPGKVR